MRIHFCCVLVALIAGCASAPPQVNVPSARTVDESDAARWEYNANNTGRSTTHLQNGRAVIWHGSTRDPIERVLKFYEDLSQIPNLSEVDSTGGVVEDATKPGRPKTTFEYSASGFSRKPGDPIIAERTLGIRTVEYFITGFISQEPRDGQTRITLIYDVIP